MRDVLFLILLAPFFTPVASHADAIHDAAKAGDVAAIASALDAGAKVDESDGQATPLYLAVRGGHMDAAKLLIDRGADVNAAPTLLGPPLMAALAKRRVDLIGLLLDRGADPNSYRNREAALHIAARSGCLDCVKALVGAGADVNAKTKDGKSALHLAKFKSQPNIADYLLSHGAVVPKAAPISDRLADADVEKGRIAFLKHCTHCHKGGPTEGGNQGPTLWNVVGRDKASVADRRYSQTLLAWQGVWTYEDLNTFLLEPMVTTPGVYMEMGGVPDETERTNLIAYLRTRSDSPIALP